MLHYDCFHQNAGAKLTIVRAEGANQVALKTKWCLSPFRACIIAIYTKQAQWMCREICTVLTVLWLEENRSAALFLCSQSPHNSNCLYWKSLNISSGASLPMPVYWPSIGLWFKMMYPCFNTKIVYGVPQGSILKPILLPIYRNDIVNIPESRDIILFADDTNAVFSFFFLRGNLDQLEEFTNSWLRKL